MLSQLYSKQKLNCDVTGHWDTIVRKCYSRKNYPELIVKPLKEILDNGITLENNGVTVRIYHS